MTSFVSKLFRRSSVRSRRRSNRCCFEALESRLVLSTVSVAATAFGSELRIDGTLLNENFTVDYSADVYTITDTNPLIAGLGATQVNLNTVTVPGASVSDRVLVRMFNGTNTIVINGNGGSGWGNEGLQVNNQTTGAETATIGAGGVSVQAGAGRGQVVILADAMVLGGDITTINNAITFGDSLGDTVDVVAASIVDAGTAQVTANGSITSSNSSDLTVSGSNTLFKNNVTGLGMFVVDADSLALFDANVDAVASDITAFTQVRITGTLTGDSSTLNSTDLRLASAVVNDVVIEVGVFSVTGTINPAVFAGSSATLRSRVPGNQVTVYNTATSPTDVNSLILNTTNLAWFAGYEQLIIGGAQNGVQTSNILFVDNALVNRLVLPTNTELIAQTIDLNEGIDLGLFTVGFRTTTLNGNNASSFAGNGAIEFIALATADGGNDTITVNGRTQSRSGSASLSITAGVSATINAIAGNFSSVIIETPVASFTAASALTSNGVVWYNQASAAGTLNVNGGIFANGDILVNGDYNLLGNNLLQARGGGDVQVSGAVTGNGFSLEIRGVNAATPANLVSLGGAVTSVSRFAVDHVVTVDLFGSVGADAAAGSDIFIRANGNLQIGGDLIASDRVDLKFATADLNGGNRLIDSIANTTVSLIGDLNDPGQTLTIGIVGGTYIRNGSNDGVTIVLV